MSGGLNLPKGKSAAELLQELNAEHAPAPGGENEGTNVTTLQETNEVTPAETNDTTESQGAFARPNGRRTPRPAARETGGAGARVRPAAQAPNGETPATSAVDAAARAERLARAQDLAATDEIAVVTVRVSAKLNEYMDRYVERLNRVHPRRRYRKQDAIAEAFAAFFADHPLPPAPAEEDL